MKRNVIGIIGLLLILLLGSCINIFQNSITGNGNVVSEMRQVPSFNEIKASAGLNVYVQFGEERSEIEVVADENLLEVIKTEVSKGELKIYTRHNIRKSKSKDIFIYAGRIDGLDVSSAASIIGENILDSDDLDLDASSAGELHLEVDCSMIEIDISSSAEATLTGHAIRLDAELSSAASLDARDLQVEECEIDVSSAADASINVTKVLEANASSAGNIRFTGNPAERKINTSSAGSVREN